MIRPYPGHSSVVACIADSCIRRGQKCRLAEPNQISQLSTYVSNGAKFGNYLPGLRNAEPSADILRPDFLAGNHVNLQTVEKFLLLLISTSLEDLRIKLADDQESRSAG